MTQVVPLTMAEFMLREVPPRKSLLGSWCKERTATLISGLPGSGKSFFVQSIALAIAGNRPLFGWEAQGGAQVGIYDGENDDEELQDRFLRLAQGLDASQAHLKILTRSMMDEQLKRPFSLSEGGDQELLLKAFASCQIIIIDNLNCCFEVTDENSSRDWAPVQSFIFKVKQTGKALILAHHTSKSNPKSPAGNSKNVRVFDYSFVLEPNDVAVNVGTQFDLTLHKKRGNPPDIQPLRAQLIDEGHALRWEVTFGLTMNVGRSLSADEMRALELRKTGFSLREVEEMTGVDKSRISRIQKKAKQSVIDAVSLSQALGAETDETDYEWEP